MKMADEKKHLIYKEDAIAKAWLDNECEVVELSDIEDMPPVDAVEVVRCKDCKHRADVLDCGNYLCNRKMLGMVRPNDFCSFGERKDNDV